MNNQLYGKLIFELSHPGRKGYSLPDNGVEHHELPAHLRRDSDALRAAPGSFERLRGDYWVRREPSAFTLTLLHGTGDLASRLERIGFKVKIQ